MEKSKAVSNFTLFHQPIHGIVDGKPVRLCAFGDVEGNSPSYLAIDSEGRSRWASFDDVKIVDTNYLPLAADALRSQQPLSSPQRVAR